METIVEDIVIVGAEIAGLATSLGLHRHPLVLISQLLGIQSLVLESSKDPRVTGFALSLWTKAWKALDALGIDNILRQQHLQLHGNVPASLITGQQTPTTALANAIGKQNVTTSLITGQQTSSTTLANATGKYGNHEVRCVRRQLLLEALANELPIGTIRFSSKVVAIEESAFIKLVHLADGTVIKTKVLIGCDGVNSVVAKWLGLNKATFSGRLSIRGCITLKSSHKLEPMFMQFFGKGCRNGVIPCDDKTLYWFFTCTPTEQEKKLEENPARLKQFVLEKLENMPSDVKAFIENTDLDNILSSPLRYRPPWELLFGNINKRNVCVAGDAFHPMTPDLGQGGCCSLEDGVVLARCLGEVFCTKSGRDIRKKNVKEETQEEQYKRIEVSLKKYANERRWRTANVIFAAYVTGIIQQGESKLVSFLRDKLLAAFLAGILLKIADFDCGKLRST